MKITKEYLESNFDLDSKEIYLMGIGIDEIEKNAFDNFKKLEELYLNRNKLTKIEGLENLIELEMLYLDDNKITKMEGLEKQSVRKGEWLVYYDNGDIKAKLNFDNDKLNGLIELYDKNGLVTAKDIAANGYLNQRNDDIVRLLLQYFHTENRPIWSDSLNIMLDTLTTKLNKK
jgi:antitoxin component YwqK of YwqJK toxin-antitoxin module